MKRMTIVAGLAVVAAGVFAMPAGFTDDFDVALKKAAAEKKTVLALFTGSDWCIWCKRLEGEVLSQKAFSDEVGKTFVPVFLDFPSDKSLVKEATAKRNGELSKKYAVRGYPTVLLLDAKGEVLGQTGYKQGGPEKYLAHLKGLVANGPLLQKYIKPYEKRFEEIGRKFSKAASAEAAKTTGDRAAKDKAVKAALPKIVGPILADMQALRKDIVADKVPEAIADDKAALLEQIDKAIEFLTKASKGELP